VSSPITFSGFNNIDFSSIVNALMQQASQPLTTLQTNQTAVKSQITNYQTLSSRIGAVQSAAAALGDISSISAFKGTSSDENAVGISTTSNAKAGHFDVVVNTLAKAQVTVSSTSAPDADTTVVASGGTLTIGGVDVTVSGDVTLQQLADAINNTDGIGVQASVIRTAPGTYRLALSSLETGQANAFTITNNLTGGSGVAFGGNAVDASDASLLVNNIPVTSTTNTIEDIVPGVTLTAYKADPNTTVRLDVSPSSDDLKAKVQSFITSYNALVQFADDQRDAAGKGDASSIGHDPLLRQLRNSLRTELLGSHGSETISKLAEVGVEFTTTGTLQLNEGIFDSTVADHAADIQSMFAGSGGVFSSVDSLLDGYSQSNGFISTATAQLNKQVSRMDDQIADMQDRLAIQKAALQQEFAAADAAISALNSQRDSLSNFQQSLGSSL
jgi:flagellar hook-associated protein 2